jgi:hypothetical protein
MSYFLMLLEQKHRQFSIEPVGSTGKLLKGDPAMPDLIPLNELWKHLLPEFKENEKAVANRLNRYQPEYAEEILCQMERMAEYAF